MYRGTWTYTGPRAPHKTEPKSPSLRLSLVTLPSWPPFHPGPTPHTLSSFSWDHFLITSSQILASGSNLVQGSEKTKVLIQKEVPGHTLRQDLGSGCQLCQKTLRQCQMRREFLRPWAEPEPGSQHHGQCRGSTQVLPWVTPLAGPQGPQRGVKNSACYIQSQAVLWSVLWCLGVADLSSPYPPCKPLAQEDSLTGLWAPCFCFPAYETGFQPEFART